MSLETSIQFEVSLSNKRTKKSHSETPWHQQLQVGLIDIQNKLANQARLASAT